MWTEQFAEHHWAYKVDKKWNQSSCVWKLKTRTAHLYWMAYRRWLIIIILHLCRNYAFYIMKYGEPLTGSQPGQFYSPNPIPLGTLDNVWRHLCLSQLKKCSWHLAGRSQGAPSHLTAHRATTLTTKNNPAQNVSSAEGNTYTCVCKVQKSPSYRKNAMVL